MTIVTRSGAVCAVAAVALPRGRGALTWAPLNTEETGTVGEEWRVEVDLDDPQHGYSLAERLGGLRLDEEARERLGSGVIVTRDGPRMYLYARDEGSAREAESVVGEMLREDDFTAQVRLTRWHPVAEEWRDAAEPLPRSAEEEAAERTRREAEERAHAAAGHPDWEVGVRLERWRDTLHLAAELEREGLHVQRRWKYLLVAAASETDAAALADRIRAIAPADAILEVIANPDLPSPGFVLFPRH